MLSATDCSGEMPAIMERISGGELAHRLETRQIRKGGEAIDVSLTISPILSDAGALTGAATIARDISARKQAEAALVLAHRRAVETSRAKSEFVANISHEIRTPLNGVLGMTTLLGETSLDELQREYLDALVASNKALVSVVDDVLDFSRLQAGRLELVPIEFDCRKAVEEAMLMLAGVARANGLEIGLQIERDVPAIVRGDRARLRQVLLKLLANAVEFTDDGEVLVRVSVHQADQLLFTVSDTGPGIEPGRKAALFGPFVQADQSSTRLHGGAGLGLAIARELVQLMGGEIGVEARAGGGSAFWFTAQLPQASAVGDARARPDLLGLRTLILGEDAADCSELERYLRSWSLACNSVQPSIAIEALERASREGAPFSVAVLDAGMTVSDCAETARAIRLLPALASLPLVVIAPTSHEPSALAGTGRCVWLTRPVDHSEIYAAIGEALNPPAALPPGPVDTPAVAAGSARSGSRRDGPCVLLAEDNEINRAVAEALLARLGLQAEIAEDGREAVEMAGAKRYAAILMDCQMPSLDGYEATRRIREAEHGRRTPIIALTAHSMAGDRERCLAAGMDDYLAKPVRAEALQGAIGQWLPELASDKATAPRSAGPAALAEALGQGRERVDRAVVAQLRQTLTPTMRAALIDTFEQSLTRCLADMAEAARLGDREELARLAHTLKGSSATVGAAWLSRCCERLQARSREDRSMPGAELPIALQAAAAEAVPALRAQLL